MLIYKERPAISRSLFYLPQHLHLRRGTFGVGHHCIHLDQYAGGQFADSEYGAGRQIAREVFGVDGVDRIQIRDIAELDIDLDDIVHHVADALHNCLDIAQALGGLLLDAACQDLASGGVNRQLRREMVVVGEGDGLAMERAARCLVGIAGTDHQIVAIFHQLRRGAVTVGDDRIHLH